MKETLRLSYYIIISFILSIPSLWSQADSSLNLPDELKNHVKYLASDELEGRYPGTNGAKLAAEYIETNFKNLGLKPINGSFRQLFTVPTEFVIGSGNKVQFDVIVPKPGVPREMLKPLTKSWETGTDWTPANFSENGTAKGEMVFVGYGITAKELNYDDYQGIDVKDKIVICLTNSPEGENPNQFSGYTNLRYKATNARDRGAIGMIIIKINSDSANVFDPLTFDPIGRNSGIVAIQANRTSIAKFFPRNMSLFPIEQEINKTLQPKSFVLPDVTASITVDLQNKETPTENIIAWIEGSEPSLKDRFIVIGAHWDHLGLGGPTSLHIEKRTVYGGKIKEVHNGADDNASGVAGLIELARHFSRNPLRKSILFIAFGAEELGLKGSEYFCNNPLIPLEKIDVMLNMDMIGRLRNNTISLFGAGSSPVFNSLLDSIGTVDSILITRSQDGFGPSDHASFYRKGVPVIMFITGVHEDYHKPSDDWEKINYKGQAHVLRYIKSITASIDGFNEKLPYQKVQDISDEEKKERGHRYGSGVWFGIVPNFEENPKGCKIGGTSPKSPAEAAGLKENDIIIKFGDKDIKNLYDLTYSLKSYKAGDKVIVRYLQAPTWEKEVEVEVTLKGKQ